MNTYLNLTREEIEESFKYDREKGKVYSRLTDQEVGYMTVSGLVIKKRIGHKVLNLSAGKMCYFLEHDVVFDKYDKICYKDGDCTNLKPDNLCVVRHIANQQPDTLEPYVEIDRRIFYDPNKTRYVVRRGPTQAVYRTFDLKEAISIRNEWESDNSIHKWDESSGIYRKYL